MQRMNYRNHYIKNKTRLNFGFSILVEAARIELASREPSTRNTTSVAYAFIFISFNSHRQDLNDTSSLISLNHLERNNSDSPFYITPTISLQAKTYCRRAAIKLLTPIRYRWQLMFFPVFYEDKEPRLAFFTSVFPVDTYRPHLLYFNSLSASLCIAF